MRRILGVVLLAAGLVIAAGSPAARASGPSELLLPGPAFFPESITAAPDGSRFVSSLVTGEIVRFAPGASEPETFVAVGVNVGTAGVMADAWRGVLWACAVDLSSNTASELRAFDLRTGKLEAGYTMPDGGVCGDIALAGDDVYVTDTALGRILRLEGTGHRRMLAVWSDDPQLTGGTFPKINGIAFDGRRTIYTTNYSTGELFAIRIAPDGSPQNARPILLNDAPLTNPDGIRWRDGFLYVADNTLGLVRVDPRRARATVIDDSLDQPTSLVFTGRDVWITEGQVLRLQMNQPPNLPFKVVRRCLGP
jgi:sugar lactone lactonase YvrE